MTLRAQQQAVTLVNTYALLTVSSGTLVNEEVALGDNITLKLSCKPKLEKVSPAMWVVANLRILEDLLLLYTMYLLRTLKPRLVNPYINIVRFLHLECGLSHPSKGLWMATAPCRVLTELKYVKLCVRRPSVWLIFCLLEASLISQYRRMPFLVLSA